MIEGNVVVKGMDEKEECWDWEGWVERGEVKRRREVDERFER